MVPSYINFIYVYAIIAYLEKIVSFRDVLNIATCICISTVLVRQNNVLNKTNILTAYVLIFKAIFKCPFLRDNKFCVVK